MRKLAWWETLTLKLVAFGAAGAAAGALVASSRETDVSSGISWGLFGAAVVLLMIGAYPGHQTFRTVPAALPYSVRRHTEARLWERLGRPRSMLSNGVAALGLVGIAILIAVTT